MKIINILILSMSLALLGCGVKGPIANIDELYISK